MCDGCGGVLNNNGGQKIREEKNGKVSGISWRCGPALFFLHGFNRSLFASPRSALSVPLQQQNILGLGLLSVTSIAFAVRVIRFVQSMIPATRMSATARAATLRSQMSGPKMNAVTTQQLLNRTYSSAALDAATYSRTTVVNRPVFRLVSPYTTLPLTRSFHAATTHWQQQQQQKEKQTYEAKDEGSKEEGEGKQEGKEEGKEGGQKETPPPPPPHGDKSPWQVFTETLQSEFKASKEWNESTKALASSAHQFSENENVKRARAAYEASREAATSKTSTAFKSTGQALGKGAAWTWNTSVVKGLRKGVNATGSGIEKATRPVRETEAYKTAVGGVKDAIDDGSSSRYGGWIEKEERRKQRQLRDEMEAKSGRRRTEPMIEDPK